MPHHTDDRLGDRAEPDPLLLFASEPEQAGAPPRVPEIPKEISKVTPPPEIDELRVRLDAAERALRESRKEVAALNREMANFVSAIKDIRPARPHRWAAAVGTAVAILIVAAAIGWLVTPSGAPPIVAAPAPEPEPIAEASDAPAPAPPPAPILQAAVATATPLLARDVIPKPQEIPLREPRKEYVGTLTVDAVPGGEVFINRKSVGKTPVRLTGLRAGSHLVWIERDGYRLWTRVVLVPADTVTHVNASLEAADPTTLSP